MTDEDANVAQATNGMPAVITAELPTTDDQHELGISYVADVNQVVDVTAPGVILQIGDVRISLDQLLQAFTRERERLADLPLPDFDPDAVLTPNNGVLPGPNGEVYVGPLPQIPITDKDIYGYDRAMSDWALPQMGEAIVIPIINPDLALPPIITNPVEREFHDTRQGARLLASTPDNNHRRRVLLAEFPPAVYHIYMGGTKTPCLIPTPYIVALAYPFGNHLNLYASGAPITAMDQKLVALPFPHVDANGRVCVGTNPPRRNEWDRMRSLEVMSDFMTHYWHTAFKYFLYGFEGFRQSLAKASGITAVNNVDRYNVKTFMEALETLTLDQVCDLDYESDPTTSITNEFSNLAKRFAPKDELTWMITPEQMAQVDTAQFYTQNEIDAMNDVYLTALGVKN